MRPKTYWLRFNVTDERMLSEGPSIGCAHAHIKPSNSIPRPAGMLQFWVALSLPESRLLSYNPSVGC
jgi:hypothetical protein